jgi:nitric oxide reductase large subunit
MYVRPFLSMMVAMNPFPGGVLQVWDVVQNGYWHARSLEYIGSERSILIEWLRLPGDLVFILFGARAAGNRSDQRLRRRANKNQVRGDDCHNRVTKFRNISSCRSSNN